MLDQLVVLLLFDDLELARFLIEDELLAGEDHSLVGLHGVRVQYPIGQLKWRQFLVGFDLLQGERALLLHLVVQLMDGELCTPGDLLLLVLLAVEGFFLFGRVVVLILFGLVVLEVLPQHRARITINEWIVYISSLVARYDGLVPCRAVRDEALEIARVLCTLDEAFPQEVLQVPQALGVPDQPQPLLLEEVVQAPQVLLELLVVEIASDVQLPQVLDIRQHLHELDVLDELRVELVCLLGVVRVELVHAVLVVHVLAVAVLLEVVGVLAVGHQLRDRLYIDLNMLGKDLGESKLGSQLKHLRDLDLDQMEKPKTLVILHYCGKRISVPLFQEVANLAQLLYHHIAKLEQAILSNEPAWEKNSKAQIVCFEIKKDGREFRPEKESDGDLRSDVLLSLLRIESKVGEDSAEELAFRVDVTKVYKYLEIQPFYRYFQQELSHVYQRDKLASNDFPYFHFHRLLSQSKLSSTFLARRISNGHFYSVKVYCSGAKTGIEDHKTIEHMQNIDELRKDSEIKSSLLVKTHQVALIPHPETEDEQSDDEMTCKYIALASPFFVRGTLEEMLKDARYNRSKRILEMDCLNYLKELMWGAHLLHEKYNIVHRAIVPANLWIDQNGQLRLTSYYSCIPCYDANGHYASYQHKSRGSSYHSRVDFQQIFEEGEYDLGEFTPPEVAKGQPYNYLVDFYTIGVIIRKLYELSQAYERVPVSQNNENLMMTMINRLTSPDLREREAIVLEIIEDIERENLQGNQQVLGLSNLVLQDIKLGRPIELSQSKKFIESEESYNGVDLQVITAYFRKPKAKPLLKPAGKKITRKVSKEKLSVKNSREKSQKSMSKTSELQAARKVSKKKMGSISKDSQTSQSRESKLTQVRKEVESPSHKKPSKSKSHEKKKKQEQNQSLKLKHGQQDHKIKQSSAPVVPKSPKANILPRNPLQVREKLK